MNHLHFSKNISIPILIFLFFFVIYTSTNGGHLDYYDGTSAFLMTEYFVLNGSPLYISEDLPSIEKTEFPIERHIKVQGSNRANAEYEKNIEYYTNQEITKENFVENYLQEIDKKQFPNGNYVILPTIAAFFYLLANFFQIDPIYFVPLVTNSIILAISVVIVYKLSELLFGSKKIGLFTALIFGLTSFLWPYAGTMLARPLAILFLLLSVYLILYFKKDNQKILPFIAGLCLGLSVLTHPLLLLVIPGVMVFGLFQLRFNKKIMFSFVIGLVIIFLIQASLNYVRFGDIEQFGMMTVGDAAGHRFYNL